MEADFKNKFLNFIRNKKDTDEHLSSSTAYYLNLFESHCQPDNTVSWFRKFNGYAFWFNMYWFAYRKMYGYAFLLCLWYILPALLLPPNLIISILSFVSFFLIGFYANAIYLRNIVKNMQSQKPPKFGVSSMAVFVFFVLSLLFSVAMVTTEVVVQLVRDRDSNGHYSKRLQDKPASP